MSDEELKQLFAGYRNDPTQETCNRLIENYLPLVKSVAERLHSRMPREVDLEDLMSDGVFGLMDAIDSFDPDRGVAFETFSSKRIRGAIIDRLRTLDWVPRLVRSRRHKLEDAYRQFEIKYGPIPTDDQLADEMKISHGEFLDLAKSATAMGLTSLDRKYCGTDEGGTVSKMDVLGDERIKDVAEHLQRQDVRELVTRGLNPKERLLVILYYYEEMTMRETGAALKLSESRVSQMHASILLRLRKQLGDRRGDFVS